MVKPTHISKQSRDVEDLDFDTLREAGIKSLQDLSGQRWTDFNLHDPGITIFEALCYGLSDLAYRTGFDITDYFVGEEGVVDFDSLALFRPDEVLPCDPVTVEDLRRAILGDIPEISNVWLERTSDGPLSPALHMAFVELASEEANAREVERRLHEAFSKCRPLGEDIGEISFVERERFGLRGEIEISSDSDALSILAELYWRAGNYVNPRPTWVSYNDAFARQPSLDLLLRGPVTEAGWMKEGELASWRDRFFVSELIGILVDIEGVARVNQLCFVSSAGYELETVDLGGQSTKRRVAEIGVSVAGSDRVTVVRNGRREEFHPEDIQREVARLSIQRKEFRSREQSFDWIGKLMPTGTARPFDEYHSVQHHFPDVYGLNAYGLPPSAEAKRHAQALQLKAYLQLQEQLLANFLAQIKLIPRLFAINASEENSYAFLALGNEAIPRIEELYPKGLSGQQTALNEILSELDDWTERRHRLLNRLLAMHGHDDTRRLADSIAQARGLNNRDSLPAKQYLLTNICDFGGRRMLGGGTDGVQPGLETILSVLFGRLHTTADDPDIPLRVIDHIRLRNGQHGFDSSGAILFRISIVVSNTLLESLGDDGKTLLQRAVALFCPAHIVATTHYVGARRFAEIASLLANCNASEKGADRDTVASALINILISER